ncbi:hypothetical protein F5888DRAFT_1694598, partial [Russula emetica]
MCNTIGYSHWISWTKYAYNCTKTTPPGSFPNPIPAGTRLPQWALLDVINENKWNASKSYAVGDGNLLLCLPPLVTASHLHLTSVDTPEL